MSLSADTALHRLPPGWKRRGVDLLLTSLVFAAYTLTLASANGIPLAAAAEGGAANTVPVIVFGSVARRLIRERLIGRPLLLQAVGHGMLAAAYSLMSYWLLIVLLGLVNDGSPLQFMVRPFVTRAMSWQLLENLTTYALIACLTRLQARPAAPVPAAPTPAEPARAIGRYFIRRGDDLQPIDVDDIVSIAGADDYAEVVTGSGRHLVRLTLAELEQSLDPARFLRVHRSRIVNVDRVERAEPAGGGRLLLHMQDGEAVATSRAGARRIRDRLL